MVKNFYFFLFLKRWKNRDDRNLDTQNKLINDCISSFLNHGENTQKLFDQVQQYSMYVIPSAFEGIQLFDERYSLGSDRDHNLPSNIK